VGRTGAEIIPGSGLSVVLTPTPRWPDLMCLYDATSQTMFTSKMFSAHVAPQLAGSKVGGRLVWACLTLLLLLLLLPILPC
jgi:flavorubredoxin